ncbi:2-oxoglutarate and iron-dependent oxygenase domain-containing protein 3 isoform X2 [Sorex araneus]|uniref:2-oxoglutarate and iron-dependent oxygenase domain-containing protein 3 isoform X2 n=1 Tax=Sorex araneus TaxID=42254 RepID=UPI00243382A7|nr:2-oxoglutarate and iron-dependent oxygenase domain-containing protein 3 isoform X2 [Sorex araneus]
MAPQRRGPPRAHEAGAGAPERRRHGRKPAAGNKGGWTPKQLRRKWLSAAAVLGACIGLAGLLLWDHQQGEEGVTEVLAGRNEVLPGRFFTVPCSEDYDSHRRFEASLRRGWPWEDLTVGRCGPAHVLQASILDLHSGALSVGKHFVNLYRYFGDQIQNIFSEEDFQLYRDVRRKVQLAIAQAFGISASALHLTKPTFFSRINSTGAQTAHDEYWHAHVDKVTYGSFDYTSLLYLSDYLDDFGGGRFVFMEDGANRTVEPRAGRVSFFTSGSENLHRVEKVRWGTRYAITIAFSCNPDHGISDPAFGQGA